LLWTIAPVVLDALAFARNLVSVRNYAHAIVAADFLTVVTARFLYVFLVMEVGTRRLST
jgi:hypothetical protein